MKTSKSTKKEMIKITLSSEELKYLKSLVEYEKNIFETLTPQKAELNKYKKVIEIINKMTSKLNVSSF